MDQLPEDPEALKLLDGYLARLQTGDQPDRDAFLAEHPELVSALDCLDALEALAPAEDPSTDPGDETIEMIAPEGALPRTFGQYELLGEIGRGGMGVVYKARQTSLDRTVAIKMILASHLASAEHVRRFQVESKAAAKLRHSNIVQIHEVGQIQGQDYFAMEYIEGESLAQRLTGEDAHVDVETAVRLLADVARAVDHLHGQGIVHRDLKPSNILLDADGQPYVSDFGLAKVFVSDSQHTASGVIAGTPSYMAPEQASGHSADVGPAADVYSLGAILYELLTGRPPFQSENPIDTLMDVLGRDPVPPRRLNRHIPRELELICLKCLAKAPKDRYASAAALADDLERFARGEVLEAKPPNLAQKFWGWTRREPALVLRLLALGVFFIVEQFNYNAYGEVTGIDAVYHLKICCLIGMWALASLFCQKVLDNPRWPLKARFAWGILDSILLLAVLLISDGAASPLVIGYPLLIVASGLWFHVRFVWLMTGLSIVSYSVVIVDFYRWRNEAFRAQFDTAYDRHLIFLIALLFLGLGVAYMVHRVRVLSRYCGRPLA